MPVNVWNRTINYADLTRKFHAGEVGIEEHAQKVADRIEQSGWPVDTDLPGVLSNGLDRLRRSTSTTEFAFAFETIYDVADHDRVWIEAS